MRPKLDMLGSAMGVLGLVLCLLAAGIRFTVGSNPDFLTMRPATLLMVGIGIMVFACWMKLEAK